MPNQARIYIGFVIAAGIAILATSYAWWESRDPLHYLIYLLLTILTSALKVKLPGMTGTLSLNFLFLLIGVSGRSFGEAVTMGCAAALVQSVWKAKLRPKLVQVLFNVASLAISVAVSYFVFHLALFHGPNASLPALMVLVACVYFLTNTVLVSAVLSLVEGRPLQKVWRQCFLWSFPYYLVGAVLIGLLGASGRSVDWQSSLLALPLMYLIYLYYRLYVDGRRSEKRATSGPWISEIEARRSFAELPPC